MLLEGSQTNLRVVCFPSPLKAYCHLRNNNMLHRNIKSHICLRHANGIYRRYTVGTLTDLHLGRMPLYYTILLVGRNVKKRICFFVTTCLRKLHVSIQLKLKKKGVLTYTGPTETRRTPCNMKNRLLLWADALNSSIFEKINSWHFINVT